MLSKLALRNAKRSFKDYIIYLITITIAFALIFSFNVIIFTEDIQQLSTNMESFQIMTIFISVLIVFIIGILINYMNKFIFEKRSREFGTYLLLGIEKKKVSQLFLLEQIGLGLFSLVISIILGSFLSQLFTALIMNIFTLPYIIKFNFTFIAVFLTALYFIIIYLVVLFKSYRRIKKMNIHDLIYYDKVNEITIIKNNLLRSTLFVISTIIGGLGLYLFDYSFSDPVEFYFPIFLLSLLLIIISIYGISMTLPNFILSFLLKNKKIKYKKDHLFILRHLTSKINTLGITMGTLTVLITATMVCLNISNLFTQAFNYQTDLILPYDLKVTNNGDNNDFIKPINIIKDRYTIEQQIIYKTYTDNSTNIADLLDSTIQNYNNSNIYIKLTDYNHLTALLGMDPITIENNQYLINCAPHILDSLKKDIDQIDLYDKNNQKLINKAVISEHFTNSWSTNSFVIVVADEMVSHLTIADTNLIVDTLETTEEQFYYDSYKALDEKEIISYSDDGVAIYSYSNIIQVQGYYLSQNRTALTTMAFSLLYLSFIFIAVTGTILAIQCLSDSTKYTHRYRLLNQLGLEKSSIHKTVFKQLLFTFVYPLIYPIIICIGISLSVNKIFITVLPSALTVWHLTGITFLMFGIIYSIYFIATYIEFKKNIRIK